MKHPLSPFEQELVKAMDEYAQHATPPPFNAARMVANERRRMRVRISLATVTVATAAGIAACVAAGAPNTGHAGLPVVGGTNMISGPSAPATGTPSTSASGVGGSAGPTSGASGSGTANGGSGNGAVGSGGSSSSATAGGSAGGVVPSWPTAPTSSPFAGTVPPVSVLVSIRVGAHSEGGYDRISLEFTGQVPGYRVGYVQQVVRDGSGASVSMPGSAFLQLKFTSAQAHDDSGNPTITNATNPVTAGYPELRSYVLNGDFEGTVSVALGLAAPNGFHVSELTKSAIDHVVYVDVARK